MISDKERREVAANLRGLDDGKKALIEGRMFKLTNVELARSVVLNIGLCLALDGAGLDTKTSGDFWGLLADLIDRPTCEYVPIGYERFGCSECGNTVGLDYDVPVTDETPMPLKYCPNCGARVVRGFFGSSSAEVVDMGELAEGWCE